MRWRTFLEAVFFLLGAISLASPRCSNAVFDNPPEYSSNFPLSLEKAEKGDTHAQFEVALAYESGTGVERDYSAAALWYRKAADNGDSGAQNNLGSMYARGLGVPQSDSEAMRWYLRAAVEGHPAAQNNLGFMYASGRAGTQGKASSADRREALEWYDKAAARGYAPAEFNLGSIYFQAGSDQNLTKALVWLRKAAKHGSAAAEIELGYAYEHGYGVARDYKAALTWYEAAAERGSAQARQSLASLKNSIAHNLQVSAGLSSSEPSLPLDSRGPSAAPLH